MKTAFGAVLLAATISTHAMAADTTAVTKGQGQGLSFDQKKAELIRHIDERIANSQLEKTCAQAATSLSELQSCREKYRPQRKGTN